MSAFTTDAMASGAPMPAHRLCTGGAALLPMVSIDVGGTDPIGKGPPAEENAAVATRVVVCIRTFIESNG